MFPLDWPLASVIIAGIAGAVVVYCVVRVTNNSMMERLDRLHTRLSALETNVSDYRYRLSELEKPKAS